jgi:hypothetical protein
MNEYEKELAFENKMDQIAEYIEEIVLDAMLSVLLKIKDNNLLLLNQHDNQNNEDYPF